MNIWRWAVVVFLVGAHLAIDLSIVGILRDSRQVSEGFGFFALGFCVSQVHLVAVCAALAPGRLISRVLGSVCLGTLMWYAIVLGHRLVGWWRRDEFPNWSIREMDGSAALILGIIILAGILAAQAPITIASWRFGWRMVPPNARDSQPPDDRRFQISHLLAAMAVVSVLMALGRAILPIKTMKLHSLDRELMVILPIVTVVGAIVVLPCVWGAFVRSSRLLPSVLLWLVYLAIVTAIEFAILEMTLGPNGPPGEFVGYLACFNIAQCLSVFGSMLVLRAIGFRLNRLDRGMPSAV